MWGITVDEAMRLETHDFDTRYSTLQMAAAVKLGKELTTAMLCVYDTEPPSMPRHLLYNDHRNQDGPTVNGQVLSADQFNRFIEDLARLAPPRKEI